MLEKHFRTGACEIHGEFSSNLNFLKLDRKFLPSLASIGVVEESVLTNIFYACDKCKLVIERLCGDATVSEPSLDEEIVSSGSLNKENLSFQIVEKLLAIRDIFPDLITGIFLVPEDELKESRFAEKPVNVVISLKSFSVQAYTAWAVKNCASAAHLWNKREDRNKIWGARTLRLILALSKLHLGSTFVNVWIASYTRIISIEYFCTTPPRMIQLNPSKLYRIEK